MVRSGAFFLVLAAAASCPMNAQIRLNFFEGEVSIAGQTLSRNDNPVIAPGTDVAAKAGRMEIYLAPGEFLRLGNQSAARIVSNDTLELTAGSAILDSVKAGAVAAPVTVRFGNSTVRTTTPGEYQFNFDPPSLRISRGEAEVTAGSRTQTMQASRNLIVLGTGSARPPESDTLLSIWSSNRRVMLSSLLSGPSQPQQPLYGPDVDVTAGQSASIGLLPLATYSPYPWYVPPLPYRPGSQFFGPSTSIWSPYNPYTRYPAATRPFIHPEPPPLSARPGFQPAPVFGGSGAGLHIPGPVIGH
jgi:hypothetical protein